jgi:hypothetical protein
MQLDCCCCICFQPPPSHLARVVHPCGHIFCEECLRQACASKMECPVDRLPLTEGSIREAPSDVIELAAQCPVRCSNWKSGCPWAKDWKEWWADAHATTCSFLPPPPCGVPGCDAVSSEQLISPSSHEQGHLYGHIRLLAQALSQSLAANRALQHEVDAAKAALYAVQNDLAHVMHRQREQREQDASHQVRSAQADEISREQCVLAVPRFFVKNISVPSLGRAEAQPLEWDSRLSNKTLAVNGPHLHHTGSQRGWGTMLTRLSVRVSLGHSVRVRFAVSQADGATSPSSNPCAPSMIMVGFSADKAVLREAVANSVSVHLGSLPGCWAYQGSGFVWAGDAKLCSQLDCGALQSAEFGVGDVVDCTLELQATSSANSHELRIYCSKQASSDRILGASLPIGHRTEFDLFPAVSLGMHGVTISVERA